ncbi:MAG: asparagine synthase (glutamine-hydrolyzing) [Pseudomonadota bacterium]
MCGICGIYNEKNLPLVTSMLESIHHRGPDSFSTVLFKNNSLGECGLNIVSTKEDLLPLTDRESCIAALFNGEIYNYRELKESLSKDGYVFTSDTDSEVIIPLYKRYGKHFVNYLKGMFAIAILDQDQIILARDRFGIKPLYYQRSGDKLIFGSEIKSLLMHPDVPAELDHESFEELLVFGYVFSGERTLLKGIRQVSPGTLVAFDGQQLTEHRYYQMPSPFYVENGGRISKGTCEKNYEDCVAQLRDVLSRTFDVVCKHGKSDKGVYLSGGLDSTVMAILCCDAAGKPVHTYTLADSEDAPDLKHARQISRRLGTTHREFFISETDYLKELPLFVFHYESIVAGGVYDIQGGIAFQMLSRYISEHHKVAMTGEGADELFGGYYWPYTHPLGFSDTIKQRTAGLPDDSETKAIVKNLFPAPEDEKAYRKTIFDILMKSGLSNLHLWSVDRSCSAFGFEARPPYLYDDIADFALSLPIEFKVPDKKTTKRLFKDAVMPLLQRYDLQEIAERRKYGMPAALSHIGPQVTAAVNKIISAKVVTTHPYSRYLRNSMDVLMFDLFYYFFIHKRGKDDHNFSTKDFCNEIRAEHMY